MARRKVIEWLIHRLEHEVDDNHFNMGRWLAKVKAPHGTQLMYRSEKDIPYCKTAGCIAGTLFLGLTAKLRKGYTEIADTWQGRSANIERAAREQMGLSLYEASEMFAPSILGSLQHVKREHAIAMLKRMLTHSEINWPGVAPELLWSSGLEPTDIQLTDD